MATDWQVSEVEDTCRPAAGLGSWRSVQIEWISAWTAHLGFPALLSVPHLLARKIKMNGRHCLFTWADGVKSGWSPDWTITLLLRKHMHKPLASWDSTKVVPPKSIVPKNTTWNFNGNKKISSLRFGWSKNINSSPKRKHEQFICLQK